MTSPKGSIWRKWDLHIHTPASLEQAYGINNDETWEKFIQDLEALPPEFKVIGINDYIFLDGYERVLEFKRAGRLKNLDAIFPVIELRVDKFGGTVGHLSRVNLHVIFSDELTPKLIQDQFLVALAKGYKLEPQYSEVGKHWHAVATMESITDLGKMIIQSVPLEERGKFGSPLKEGFNGFNVNFDVVLDILKTTHYFRGKYLTAVGKTEWADIKWNDQSIAEKKNIINSVHFVFISSPSVAHFQNAKKSLEDGGVNSRLLDCSDAHDFSTSVTKDRIGKCFAWIKADTRFEGLKQAFFEPEIRIHIGEKAPLDAISRIDKATFTFPADSKIGDETFCLRGSTEIFFSPNLTCFVGGRGVGKSMILNLIHERLSPGENSFFQKYHVSNGKIPECVKVEGANFVEFLSQNEIESFATDQGKFTSAIFNRLIKLDKTGELEKVRADLKFHLEEIDQQIARIDQRIELTQEIAEQAERVDNYRNIVGFLQDEDYKKLSAELRAKTDKLEQIRSSSQRLASLITLLQNALRDFSGDTTGDSNSYRSFLADVINSINEIVRKYMAADAFTETKKEESELQQDSIALQKSLDDFLASKNLSAENLVDISRANQMLSSAEKELAILQNKRTILDAEIQTFNTTIDLRPAYEKQFSDQLVPIAERLKSLGSEVKSIDLKYVFDSEKAKSNLLTGFLKRMPPDEKGNQHREDYVSATLFKIDPEKLTNYNEFTSKLSEDSKTAIAVKRFFESQDHFEVYKLIALREYLNADKYRTVEVSYDNKPIKDSSFGQRCTTAIVVLLLLGNTPLIIDEPEAHLDSSLIAKYLVDLVKKQKRSRQIVFATHNANFVVNGDAELVNVLKMGDDKHTVVTPTTLENLENRAEILALEGGETAFKHREAKYELAG